MKSVLRNMVAAAAILVSTVAANAAPTKTFADLFGGADKQGAAYNIYAKDIYDGGLFSGFGQFIADFQLYLGSVTVANFLGSVTSFVNASVAPADAISSSAISSGAVKVWANSDDGSSWNYKMSVSGNDVIFSNNGDSITFHAVPGPVVGAGLPMVLGLAGFLAWRRRQVAC